MAKLIEGDPAYFEGGIKLSPTAVYYAGASPRRDEFLRYMFQGYPKIPIISFPAGEELRDSVVNVADRKSLTIIEMLKQERRLRQNEGNVVIAADTNTLTPEARGKPRTIEEVMANFKRICDEAINSRSNPIYLIASGSVLRLIRPSAAPVRVLNQIPVELSFEGASYLAEEEGIRRYLEVYSEHHPFSICDVSGGISLSVLTSLRVVRAIDGISMLGGDSEEFERALKYALHTASVGIAPELLRPFRPNSMSGIKKWPWLNGEVERALVERQLYI